jgi:GH15 family glucan-1,4-alpha-glucosidase
MADPSAYPPIEHHGLIGDLQTAALVSTDGTVDWFCAPRFDSPSIFASLLDPERGGHLTIRPEGTEYVTRQLYLPGTPILITRFMSTDGVGEVVDFMPVTGKVVTDRHRLVRLVRVVRGQMAFTGEVMPRFDYGRAEHTVEVDHRCLDFHSGDMTLRVSPVPPPEGPLARGDDVRLVDGGLHVHVVLSTGQIGGLVVETAPEGPAHQVGRDEIMRLFTETRDFWRRWLHQSHYTGRWREVVERSAMTLKLMTYAPTGALVAAPTMGLPEHVGGERNWDYRYTWVRDASFSVYALLGLGFREEAHGFIDWLSNRVRDASEQETPLQIMYRVDGTPDLQETTLDHLAGYRGSRPVRLGNGAATQLQLDIYGEAMDSVHLADEHALVASDEAWNHLTRVIDWLCEHWDQPDEGIWETRGGRQDFTYGRVMSWVALDRAIRIAHHRGRPGDVAHWTSMRDMVYRQVMERGWDEKRQAFVQHYDTDVLDASLLYMPLVGFLAPDDPKWLSTLAAMDDELVSDSLVYRYNPGASPDGLRGAEGTFSMCTFWYVDALARSGHLDHARLVFEKMHTYANHLGLYSEEIGPTGEQLGNFPQAFSHLALISAAINLDYQLDHAGGHIDPVVGIGPAAVTPFGHFG